MTAGYIPYFWTLTLPAKGAEQGSPMCVVFTNRSPLAIRKPQPELIGQLFVSQNNINFKHICQNVVFKKSGKCYFAYVHSQVKGEKCYIIEQFLGRGDHTGSVFLRSLVEWITSTNVNINEKGSVVCRVGYKWAVFQGQPFAKRLAKGWSGAQMGTGGYRHPQFSFNFAKYRAISAISRTFRIFFVIFSAISLIFPQFPPFLSLASRTK